MFLNKTNILVLKLLRPRFAKSPAEQSTEGTDIGEQTIP